ncbi:efflux transporter outer membrane subunit [Prosthecobacter algae]|uniref:efflux transporter outer membrane subunit n=1 Tax=Prosthecobacter algae TaxID=1144682 RepID=UPI0031EB5960
MRSLSSRPLSSLRWGTLALCVPVLVSCGLLPPLGSGRLKKDVHAMHAMAPENWAALPSLPEKASTGWLADFDSPQLRRLVEQAITANPDLKAAGARVQQAHAQTVQAGAAMFPTLTAGYNASRSQSPGDQRFPGLTPINNRFRLPFNMSWEIDFWGRIADERGAAKAGRLAAEEDFHAARLSLAANTVRTATTLAEARALLNLAEQNVRTRRVQLGILEKQLDRGLDPDRAALDVSLARADLARTESTLQQRRATVDQTQRALEVLLGGYPAGKESGIGSLPTVQRRIPAGLPSELMLRRPDLRAAERQLEASLRRESAAKKAFLPSIRLTGEAGRTSQDMDNLLAPDSAIWSIAANGVQTLFQGGRLVAGVKLERGRYEELLATYKSRALTAFQEVETALAADRFLESQAAALSRAVTEAGRSESLALGQYEKGLTDVLTLLDASQRAFDARSALISVQAQRLRNRADLHLALGGEF